LFDLLTALESVRARPYRLEYHGRWSIDRESVVAALSPRTRALLVVSPNNPTGSCLRAADREWMVSLAASRRIALIGDEVFSSYPLAVRPDASSLRGEDRVLTFVLGGLSKSAGLPQLKLAWMAVSGPDGRVRQALEHLALVLDTYLSVATPVQVAAGRLLAAGETIREAIAGRLRQNLDLARRQVRQTPALTLFEPEGGWSAVIRVPATDTEENIVLGLVSASGVLVHPGYFFDFAEEAFLVVSLLPEPEIFEDAMARLAIRFADSGS
jgi:hypothetical protein